MQQEPGAFSLPKRKNRGMFGKGLSFMAFLDDAACGLKATQKGREFVCVKWKGHNGNHKMYGGLKYN